MGFRQAAVLTPVSFFLGKYLSIPLAPALTHRGRVIIFKTGIFFICFNVDHKILWSTLTEEVVEDGFQFYTTFFNAPPAIKVGHTT